MNKLQKDNFLLALGIFVHSVKNKGEKKFFFYQDETFLVDMYKDFRMIDNVAAGVLVIKEIAFPTFDDISSFGEVLGMIDHVNPWYATICEGVKNREAKLFLSIVEYKQMTNKDNYIKLIPTKKHDSINSNNKDCAHNTNE